MVALVMRTEHCCACARILLHAKLSEVIGMQRAASTRSTPSHVSAWTRQYAAHRDLHIQEGVERACATGGRIYPHTFPIDFRLLVSSQHNSLLACASCVLQIDMGLSCPQAMEQVISGRGSDTVR